MKRFVLSLFIVAALSLPSAAKPLQEGDLIPPNPYPITPELVVARPVVTRPFPARPVPARLYLVRTRWYPGKLVVRTVAAALGYSVPPRYVLVAPQQQEN